jgi:hypothetical protein
VVDGNKHFPAENANRTSMANVIGKLLEPGLPNWGN